MTAKEVKNFRKVTNKIAGTDAYFLKKYIEASLTKYISVFCTTRVLEQKNVSALVDFAQSTRLVNAL